MPRFFDDYSNTYLTHDSAAGRKQQRRGWKFRENFKLHYQKNIVEWQKGEMGLASAQQGYIRARGKDDPMIPTLPDGWKEDTDECTGISFYYNEETGDRSWVRPGFIPPPPGGGGSGRGPTMRGGMGGGMNNNYNNNRPNYNNNRGGNFGGGGGYQNRGGGMPNYQQQQQQQQQQRGPPPPPNMGNRAPPPPHFFNPPPGGMPPQQQVPPQPSFLHPSALPGAPGQPPPRPPFGGNLPRPPPPGGFQRPPGYG
jgi:U1 small nuclear ribonucleoprotein C